MDDVLKKRCNRILYEIMIPNETLGYILLLTASEDDDFF